MTAITDVQYEAPVAGIYDAVIGSSMPPQECLRRMGPFIAGRRVLDLGVGTGRLAIPMAAIAESVTGVDNSAAMLAELHEKDVPENLTTELVDFRAPLPFDDGSFTAAVSTMGSMACVRSVEELAAGFEHLARVLEPGSPVIVEYYSAATYRQLVGLGTVEVANPHHPSTTAMSVSIEGSQLNVETTVRPLDGSAATHFCESVLLLEPAEFAQVAAQAGFTLVRSELAENYAPFDWFVLERGSA